MYYRYTFQVDRAQVDRAKPAGKRQSPITNGLVKGTGTKFTRQVGPYATKEPTARRIKSQ